MIEKVTHKSGKKVYVGDYGRKVGMDKLGSRLDNYGKGTIRFEDYETDRRSRCKFRWKSAMQSV